MKTVVLPQAAPATWAVTVVPAGATCPLRVTVPAKRAGGF
jgi:hypothetical protein